MPSTDWVEDSIRLVYTKLGKTFPKQFSLFFFSKFKKNDFCSKRKFLLLFGNAFKKERFGMHEMHEMICPQIIHFFTAIVLSSWKK